MKKKPAMTARTFQLWGWFFFILSSLFFIVASYRAGDWLSLSGGMCFLIANIIFLIPVVKQLE